MTPYCLYTISILAIVLPALQAKPSSKWEELTHAVEKAGGLIQFDDAGNPTSLDLLQREQSLQGTRREE